MRFGTCKDCCKEFPLLEEYRVQKRDIWECDHCKCPNSLSDMTIVEKEYYYVTTMPDRHHVRRLNPNGSWFQIAVCPEKELAERIVNALNDQTIVWHAKSNDGNSAICATLSIAQEWVVRDTAAAFGWDWKLPVTWHNWKWWQDIDSSWKFFDPSNKVHGTVEECKVIEFTNML